MGYVSNTGSTWESFPSTGPIIKLTDEYYWKLDQRSSRESNSRSKTPPAHTYALAPRQSTFTVEARLKAIHTIQKSRIEVRLARLSDLQEALEDDNDVVRLAVVETLGTLGDHIPVGTLMLALTDPFWNVRAAAARVLGQLGERTPIKHLVNILKQEQDENVREAIIRTLGKQGRAMPLDILIHELHFGKNWLAREAAAWALGELGENTPIQELIETLQHDPDESVRATAAKSLGQSWTQEAELSLFEALHDPDEDVQIAAAWALQQLDEETRGVKEWGESYNFLASTPTLVEDFFVDIAFSDWEQTPKGQAFLALTEFISDKKGCVSETNLLETRKGLVLMIDCFYQSAEQSLQETVLQSIENPELLRPIEAAFNDQNDIVREAIEQAFKIREKRQWRDLLIVSFELLPTSDNREQCPLRVIVSGMGCQRVREHDTPVLNQIVEAWTESVEEPLICQHLYNLADLKIWYQSAPNSPDQRLRAG